MQKLKGQRFDFERWITTDAIWNFMAFCLRTNLNIFLVAESCGWLECQEPISGAGWAARKLGNKPCKGESCKESTPQICTKTFLSSLDFYQTAYSILPLKA